MPNQQTMPSHDDPTNEEAASPELDLTKLAPADQGKAVLAAGASDELTLRVNGGSLPSEVWGLEELRSLTVLSDGNQTLTIGADIAKLTSLEVLIVRAATAKVELSEKVCDLELLDTLELVCLNDSIPEFLQKAHIAELVFESPLLRSFPAGILSMEQLEVLYLTGGFTTVPGDLAKLSALEELAITCLAPALPEELASLPELRYFGAKFLLSAKENEKEASEGESLSEDEIKEVVAAYASAASEFDLGPQQVDPPIGIPESLEGPYTLSDTDNNEDAGYFPALDIAGPLVPTPGFAVPIEVTHPSGLQTLLDVIEKKIPFVAFAAIDDKGKELAEEFRFYGCMARPLMYQRLGNRVRMHIEFLHPVRLERIRPVENLLFARVTMIQKKSSISEKSVMERVEALKSRVETILEAVARGNLALAHLGFSGQGNGAKPALAGVADQQLQVIKKLPPGNTLVLLSFLSQCVPLSYLERLDLLKTDDVVTMLTIIERGADRAGGKEEAAEQ